MKTTLKALIFSFSSCLLSALPEAPSGTTLFFLSQGDEVEYTSSSLYVGDDWFLREREPGWSSKPAGFGENDRYDEVSSVFRSIGKLYLRHRFSVGTTPDTLTLSLKHDEAPLTVYLNDQAVISLAAADLPPAGADGFRRYDLSAHIGSLTEDGNLLALHVEGSIAVPLLSGIVGDATGIAIEPTQTRLVEGGASAGFHVVHEADSLHSIRVSVVPPEAIRDFRILKDGQPVEMITEAHVGTYFNSDLPGASPAPQYEVFTIDDDHAEAQESFELVAGGSSIRFVISLNDTRISRNTSSGEGSLHQAVLNASLMPGTEVLTFTESEGTPFFQAPVSIFTAPLPDELNQGLHLLGPSAPGRVAINANSANLFRISSGYSPENPAFSLRNLTITGADTAVNSMRYRGTLEIENCEFIGNQIAIDSYNVADSHQPVIRNCYFSDNQLCIDSSYFTPIIQNCTFFGNSETVINARHTTRIDHCTFVGDQLRFASGDVEIQNCLVVGSGSDFKVTSSDFDQGGNLFALDVPLNQPLHPDSLVVSVGAARIGSPGFNGGFTRTIPILPGSPALDLGLSPGPGSPDFDQRGASFLRRVGLAPDAGAFEFQLHAEDIVTGALSEPAYDSLSDLYFQLVVVHNLSPWTLSGFRVFTAGLPDDATLFNASGSGFIDIAGPIPPSDYQVVILQYSASRPDLNLNPFLTVELLPDSDLPEPQTIPMPASALVRDDAGNPCLHFQTEPGFDYQIETTDNLRDWQPCGPPVFSESRHILWKDREFSAQPTRYYRVRKLD